MSAPAAEIETNERNLCAAVMVGGSYAFHEARAAGVQVADFKNHELCGAFTAFAEIIAAGGEIDRDSFVAAVAKHLPPQGVSAPSLADYLLDLDIAPEQARYYATLVHGAGFKRRAQAEIAGFATDARGWEGSGPELVEEAQRRFIALSTEGAGRRGAYLRDIIPEHFKRIRAEYDNPRGLRGLPTGYVQTDRIIRGLCPGNMILIAGPSGSGKSALAVNFGVGASRLNDAHVRIYSMEMEKEEILERMAYAESSLDSQKFHDRTMTDSDWENYQEALRRLYRLNIYIEDDPGITLSEIIAECRAARFSGRLDLVIIDYAQLVTPPTVGRSATRQQEIAIISRTFKRLAGELSIPIIVLSQLNEDGKTREGRDLFNDANVVMYLTCETDNSDHFQDSGEPLPYTLRIEKNRNGRRYVNIPMSFMGQYILFRETEMGRF